MDNLKQALIENIADILDSEDVQREEVLNFISDPEERKKSELHIRMAEAALDEYKRTCVGINPDASENEYSTDCTGNCCVGDEIKFERAVFIGDYPKSKFSHTEIIFAKIIKDSYGVKKQQHTFTLIDESGNEFRIKGRNLYRNGTSRKKWKCEKKREETLNEKYRRGQRARSDRENRINNYANSFENEETYY